MMPGTEIDHTLIGYVPGQPIPSLVRDPATGRIRVNELKRYVKPYWLVTEPAAITLAGNAVSDPIPMPIDGSGHFEIMQAFFRSSQAAGFTVQLFDPDNRPILMNREINVATIASGGGATTFNETFTAATSPGRPFIWPETHWMNVEEGGKSIVAYFRNLSASSNTIRFCLHGLRWYHTQAPSRIADRMQSIYRTRFRTMPFFYTTEQFPNLAGSGTGNFEVRFSDEAWTEWHKFMSASDGRYNVRVVETSTQRRYMDTAIRDDVVTGNGEFPFLMWEPILYEPNFKLTFELEDVSGSTNAVWLTLACRKILWDPKDAQLLRPDQAGGGA